MIKTFKQAYKYLCTRTDYERMAKFNYTRTTFNLERMRRLILSLGNPHLKLKFIHIAGTKGKGSTAIIISRILSAAGYRTGLFTSPHLVDIRERIQVNNRPISKQSFARALEQIRQASIGIKGLTFFEIITAMALLYFHRNKTDFAVMEVGLGGRLDATNIIKPLVSVITRLDFDHTDKLGNTIDKIATEKAGIIKPGVPVIALRQDFSKANKVIGQIARKRKSPLYWINPRRKRPYPAPLILGRHQDENINIAAAVIWFLNRNNYVNIKPPAISLRPASAGCGDLWLQATGGWLHTIRRALAGLKLPGRIEIIRRRPYVIVDSAHNPVAIKALRDTLKTLNYRKLILIMAVARDKDIPQMLDIIMPLTDIAVFTRTAHPRLLEPMDFTLHLKEYHLERPIFLEPDCRRALKLARRLAREDDLILVTGSFYLAGEVLRIIR
jgi:dihydrofolate synthase/folylpolyglutamate synthase